MDDLLRPVLCAGRLQQWRRHQEVNDSAPGLDDDTLNIDALVSRLGLVVAQFNPAAHRDTLGYLEPGEDLIFLRAGLSEPVRRFTLAHELGHVVLHRATGNAAALAGGLGPSPSLLDPCDNGDLDSPLDVMGLGDETLRPGQAYSARARRESEANAFAAALLMPADRVRATYASSADRPCSARDLAKRFGVSEDVALRRLTALMTPGADEMEQLAAARESPVEPPAARPLDANQRAAAESATPALIIAGPGTGKTSTLVARVAYLAHERKIPPDAILALTFSNKAAREMRERVERMRLHSALHAPDNRESGAAPPAPLVVALPTIGTIHAFCGDLLRQYGPLVGLRPDFRLVTATDGYFILREATRDLALQHYQPLTAPARYFPDLLSAISRAKDELVDPPQYRELAQQMRQAASTEEERMAAERAVEVAAVYDAYQHALATRGDPDFGDIVRLAARLLQEQADVLADVRARYQHILVDEFQDINRAMGVLLHTLAGADGPLWAVGDPDQAIYRFRGASPANIERFAAEYPTARILRLTHNYRSYRSVLEASASVAKALIPAGAREPLVATRGDSSAPCVTLASAPDNRAELQGVALAIKARLSERALLSEQAVLCRTKRMTQQVVAALQGAAIPTRIVAPLLEQDDVKDLLALASLLADGSGAGLLRVGGMADHQFTREDARHVIEEAHARHTSPVALLMREVHSVPDVAQAGLEGLERLADVLRELRLAPDVATGLARYTFSLTRLGERLLRGIAVGDELAMERANHMTRVLALAHAFEDQRRGAAPAVIAGGHSGGAAWREFLEYVRVLIALRQDAGGGNDLLASAEDGVWVLTVHASKGLEFPTVYLPGLTERRFPVQRQHDSAPIPIGMVVEAGEQGEGAAEQAHIGEEACLFYVALTRARDELVLSHSEQHGRIRASRSRFIAPIEQRLGQRLTHLRWAPEAAPEQVSATLHQESLSEKVASEPLSVGALETFERCPRQFAYSYVYGLRASDTGFVELLRGVRETLATLAKQRGGAEQPLSLADAYALFEQSWTAGASSRAESEPPDPYLALYRRHGRQIVERAWAALAQPAADKPAAPDVVTPTQEFERAMTVQAHGREIAFTLDRVQSGELGDMAGEGTERAPMQFVRHRVGRADGKPDIRTLLYALAAEHDANGQQPPQLVQHHLPSGETEPIKLSSRQRAKLSQQVEEALNGIASGSFPPQPEARKCQSCAFLFICPA